MSSDSITHNITPVTDSASNSSTANKTSSHNPASNCVCGCVPPNMMSLFQMAELRAKRRKELQELKAKEENTS
ncbi:hypothetical protein EON65_49850 [archaeon]|nr:MAG: hypothetical protein EON65_49850 [archaeon]